MALVVILDDRVTNRNIFAKLAALIEPGVDVRAFGDPIEALSWFEGVTPDLVVTDYKMPGIDGAEFTRRFRALPGCDDVPVVVLTVYEERSFRLNALEAGATDFLQSPVDHHEFLTRARNLLKLRRQQLALARRASSLESELRDSSERLGQVIDTVPAMISAADRDGRCIFVNAYHAGLLGAAPEDLLGRTPAELFGAHHGDRSAALDRLVFQSGAALPSYEEELALGAGERRYFLTTKAPLRDAGGAIVAVLTTALDISDRKRAESHLRHLAHHDALTDLPNRALLHERVRHEIAQARRSGAKFALLLFDLDRFKGINDVLGHHIGDRLLKAVAERLLATVRETDTVARLGGDEFAILQTNVAVVDDGLELARRVRESLDEPFLFDGHEIATSASIGVALFPDHGFDFDDLLKNADLAMYRAKSDGRDGTRAFAAEMDKKARAITVLDSDMRRALAKKELVLHYQPQVNLASGRIVGAEALVRWRKDNGDLVSPADFLPQAEESGLIVPISEWVLNEACREAASWTRDGLPPLRVAVNLSAIQFRKQNVEQVVLDALGASGLESGRLELELTETILLHDTERVVHSLRALQAHGVTFSIDDFGTGYSSLSYVRNFPVNRLKIDRSFIRNLREDSNDVAIVRAIVNLGHSLNLDVIAEGVETAAQVGHLRAEGCDEVQGFYFGRPMPAADFIDLVRREAVVAQSA
ncbi:bifunctional diguanylate cyclase/phosphodiesterase [Methylopila jiangsuensis]|uniref:Bifunctional diguanylate cyclase/phosphodiesterase n=1 Tax=Methylopila jiangsuensis TaxID=586230 RepID=A0A9W6JG21_9HYPH|nr:EAL domain-containing protein [Methylopila jiangsuensis]MDR6287090.1 diguanylate cyclase (GGDEF)-like protein/PAS domain S-box-containing protein [Methylopila jiangsuensis]GLK76577.1 bifunctional diguanylate cyclase/phosphodiesterase [Methylopila jiangsuensis]